MFLGLQVYKGSRLLRTLQITTALVGKTIFDSFSTQCEYGDCVQDNFTPTYLMRMLMINEEDLTHMNVFKNENGSVVTGNAVKILE